MVGGGVVVRWFVGCVVGCVLCGVFAVGALGFGVVPGSFSVVGSHLVRNPGTGEIEAVSETRAGGHPDLTTSFGVTQEGAGSPTGLLRNAEVVLPVGFAGYPALVKTCDPVQLQLGSCPVGSQVGTLEVVVSGHAFGSPYLVLLAPLFNMVPAPDQTAVYGFAVRFGGTLTLVSGEIVASLGPDYRVHARAANIYEFLPVVRTSLTVWGVPADPVHDVQRGTQYFCKEFTETEFFGTFVNAKEEEEKEVCGGGGLSANENPQPYLLNPTRCGGEPLVAELVNVSSWEGEEAEPQSSAIGPFSGCEALKFTPLLKVAPEEDQPTQPTGYEVDLQIPQTEGAEGYASAELASAVVTMPKGVVLSPSAATGLQSCSAAEIGIGDEEPVRCPNASRLATVSIITPALSGELTGALYLGNPEGTGSIRNPPFTVYLVGEGHGVLLKIEGEAVPDYATGQLTTTFAKNPELPFSELKLHLTSGDRATLANPSQCGLYSAESVMIPWSAPETPTADPLSPPFEIEGCTPPQFAPVFKAGSTSVRAGGYSHLQVSFARQDADETLGGLSVTTPEGLSGNLTGVPLCPEPQAAEGICPASSRIGEIAVAAGPGPEPAVLEGGQVYLTGPYHGAPFGLSIDASEKAGPLDFGTGPCDCEVVRAAVNVDPKTAQLTVTNGTLPTMKYGIPFQIKTVNVDINRPNFVFNPTSCNPKTINAQLSSTQGAQHQAQSHFQVTNCAALQFNPTFKVSTNGHTNRANGASLTTKLTYPAKAPFGSQTNIAKVKVQLPKKLPSRLKTLQKACTAAVFEANPAGCPAASRVGYAKATTPVLPVPLAGPAYFVSHGGEAFPSLIIVLQGYGLTIDLTGATFIHKGITTSTFNTVPDVPVGTFELTLPQGPYSALAANGNLCKTALKIPTEFTAQNATIIKQNTPITTTGCRKTKKRKAHRASRAHRTNATGHRSRYRGGHVIP